MAGTGSSPLISLPGVAPALADWQWQIGSVVLGPGTSYNVYGPDGFGSPEVRNSDVARAQEDGDWMGVDTYASRTLTIRLSVRGSSQTDCMTKYRALLTAWQKSKDPNQPYTNLWYKLPGDQPRRLIGRPRRLAADYSRLLSGRIEVVAEFYSPFPAIFGENQAASATVRVVTGGGRAYPLTYPRRYNVTAVGGDPVVIINGGSYTAWPVFTFTGGAANFPKLVNQTTNAFIGFDVNLSVSDSLVVDMRIRTATVNGASVRHLLTAGASWWSFPTGETDLVYQPVLVSGAPRCDIVWSTADLG